MSSDNVLITAWEDSIIAQDSGDILLSGNDITCSPSAATTAPPSGNCYFYNTPLNNIAAYNKVPPTLPSGELALATHTSCLLNFLGMSTVPT